jgi:hypothetical protein
MYAFFSASDYEQTGREVTGTPWYHDKKNKRKKKNEGPLGVDPNGLTEDGIGETMHRFSLSCLSRFRRKND